MLDSKAYKEIEGDKEYIAVSKEGIVTLAIYLNLIEERIDVLQGWNDNVSRKSVEKMAVEKAQKMTISEQETIAQRILSFQFYE